VHILNKKEVAKMLGLTEASLSSTMVRMPESVPRWFKRPGARTPMWLRETVDAFLVRCATTSGAMPSDVARQSPKR
jgi:hypothetical protein